MTRKKAVFLNVCIVDSYLGLRDRSSPSSAKNSAALIVSIPRLDAENKVNHLFYLTIVKTRRDNCKCI